MSGATIAPGLPGLLVYFSDHPDAEYLTRLILTIPGLSIALCAPLAGYLADKLGRRVLLTLGVGFYVLAGAAGLWVDDLYVLLISRFVLGAAVGFIMVCSMALLTDHFQGEERDRVMGIQSSAMAAGGIVFIFMGSVLADLSWRAPFAVYVVPLVLFPLIYFFVSKPPESDHQYRHDEGDFPIVHAALICGIGFITMLSFYTIPSQLPFLARELGASSLKYAGFAVVVSQIFTAIASANYRRLRSRLSNVEILLLSFLFLTAGFFALSRVTTLPGIFFCMPLVGIGLGFNFPNLTIWLMSRVPSTMRGRASGGLTTAVFLGQFMSPLMSVPLVQKYGLSSAFTGSMLIMGIVIVIPSALVLLRRKLANLP